MLLCKECHEPAPKGHDLCDWCAQTPEQRHKSRLRGWLTVVLCGLAFYGFLWYGLS